MSNSYNWLATSHRSDQEGPWAGGPYDGADPRYPDLYHDVPQCSRCVEAALVSAYSKDLVDKYEPDLLYTDDAIPFEEYGLNVVCET